MKKILLLMLCLVLALALAACTPSEVSSQESSSGESSNAELTDSQKLKKLRDTYIYVVEIGSSGKYIVSAHLSDDPNRTYGISSLDELILPLDYKSVEWLSNDSFLVSKDNKYAIIKADGSVLFDYKYKYALSGLYSFDDQGNAQYVRFFDESGCVFVDANGTPLTDVFSSFQVYQSNESNIQYVVKKGDELFMLSVPAMTTEKIEDPIVTTDPVCEGSELYYFRDLAAEDLQCSTGVKDKDGNVILEPKYYEIRFIHTEEKDLFIASRNMLNNAALYDMEGNRISEEYEGIFFLDDYFEAKVDEKTFIKLDFSGNLIESAVEQQAELRQKFEDCIKITQTYCDDREENIEDFPFDITFYRTGYEPEGYRYFQLMFKLKEEFSEYSTYKIRISYYDEELCNSGEYSSEDIFSTKVKSGWPYHISFELSGEGLETIVSGKVKGEDLWSFAYHYDDVTNNERWDASKPIKIDIVDDGSMFF